MKQKKSKTKVKQRFEEVFRRKRCAKETRLELGTFEEFQVIQHGIRVTQEKSKR
jgi:hypothetical protein